MAGIRVVASYDICKDASETNFANNRHKTIATNLRCFSLSDLPTGIDVVVGSPPCTQFSFSNRGGGGDIEDGLEDVIKFLKVVDHVRPRVWALENVPRLAQIIEKERRRGGRLARFSHLGMEAHVVNMAEFGLPQRRKRCIAGNFNYQLLTSYAEHTPRQTLGMVVDALSKGTVVDPNYGIAIRQSKLNDHVLEDFLNEEEKRINQANKVNHPIYNRMPFPDPLDRSVRTVTATCTRVGRESIVIQDPQTPGGFRRLTIRERATLQGFPVSFEFHGTSYQRKLAMVGNAMPPLFAYYVGQAFREKKAHQISVPQLDRRWSSVSTRKPPATLPSSPAKRFSQYRTFKFAIPSLQLRSGVRFELANKSAAGQIEWAIAFYFGTSKSIHHISLTPSLHSKLLQHIQRSGVKGVKAELEKLADFMANADIANLQRVWCHRGPGATRPFMVLDKLHQSGSRIKKLLLNHKKVAEAAITKTIELQYGHRKNLKGLDKLARNAPLVLAGLLVGSLCNGYLIQRRIKLISRSKRLAV